MDLMQDFLRRKNFLSWTATDDAVMGELQQTLGDEVPSFVNSFYDHILAFEETKKLIKDDESLARLKRSQANYFNQLISNIHDQKYVEDRTRVGLVHAKIGLSPSWYLGAYSHYLVTLLPLLVATAQERGEDSSSQLTTLVKSIFLDIGIAIDAYIAHRDDLLVDLRDYGAAFSRLPHGTLVTTAGLNIVFTNAAFENLFSFSSEKIRGTELSKVLDVSLLKNLAERALNGFKVEETIEIQSIQQPMGVQVNVTVYSLPSLVEGEASRLMFIFEDLREQTQLLRDLLNAQAAAQIGTWKTNFKNDFSITPQTARMMGLPENKTLVLDDFFTHILLEDQAEVRDGWNKAIHSGVFHSEFRMQQMDPECVVWLEARGKIIYDHQGQPVHGYGTLLDKTEQKKSEQAMEGLAYFDALTGLANRRRGIELARKAINNIRQDEQEAILLFVDLNNFKEINDSQGHGVGDSVLKEIARRCDECTHGSDILARMGGDEFMLIHFLAEGESTTQFPQQLYETIAQPIKIGHLSLELYASIGIANCKEHGNTLEEILKCADIAMYGVKGIGGGLLEYTSVLGDRVRRKNIIGKALEQALENSQLQLHYQPKIDIKTKKLVGVEALTRWTDPELGVIRPDEFISVAQSRGLISDLGDWALEQACKDLVRWQASGITPLPPIAVNVAPEQISDEKFPARALKIVLKNKAKPEWIEFEITETGMMLDPKKAQKSTSVLKEAGFSLSIDDFGTGYSSLARLSSFPISKLKIDMSFVRDMTKNEASLAIVRTIISMAKAMNIETVSEGVETLEQLELLQEMQCDQAQGYLFGRPIPSDILVAAWLPKV